MYVCMYTHIHINIYIEREREREREREIYISPMCTYSWVGGPGLRAEELRNRRTRPKPGA